MKKPKAKEAASDSALPVRERILATASELFYRDGVRAVGIDAIIAKSGVAKASLYKWFPSKDDLIAAFVDEKDRKFWEYWDAVEARHAVSAAAELHAHLRWIARYIDSPQFTGCPFINVAAAFADPKHPGRARCGAHKEELRRRLRTLARAAGAKEADLLANQLLLLIDGAFTSKQMLNEKGAQGVLVKTALSLMQLHGIAPAAH
jgi:AcrR family transcriptional regulator